MDHNYDRSTRQSANQTPLDEDHCYASAKTNIHCPHCKKKVSGRKALLHHQRKFHREKVTTVYRHHCDRCLDFQYNTIPELISHCQSHHHDNIRILSASFTTHQEFEEWKKEREKETSSRYIKGHGTSKGLVFTVSKYYCSRSGFPRIRVVNSKKAMKAQGSCKIGKHCTSFIKARTYVEDGRVEVEYCLDHLSHSVELVHLPISDNMRSKIAAQLAQGMEVDKIIDDVRDSMTKGSRDFLVTRKDVHNIRKQFHISAMEKHTNQGVLVEPWIQSLKQGPSNPVIFYKPEGTSHDTLHNSDFLLCLQTPFQKEMFRRYHSKIICIDSTNSTTKSDFFLSTVLVLDDFADGIPVAWAVSNREGIEMMKVFLTALKSDQDFGTEVFMSDLANNFYDAWCSVFPKPKHRLFCPWHVDENWKNQLNKLIPSQEVRQETYSFLKILQSETSESNFQKRLQDILKHLSETSKPFLDYFQTSYVMDDKFRFWAECFRVGSHANTDMHTEAFQHALKNICLNRKRNKRVDKLLVVLLHIARDKAVEQLIKQEKGKLYPKIREIRKMHKVAETITGILDNTESAGEWSVPSQTISGLQYSVKKISSFEVCHCNLVCNSCNVCIHMYKCTCPYFLTHPIVCKHIHAVHMLAEQMICPADTGLDHSETVTDNAGTGPDHSETATRNMCTGPDHSETATRNMRTCPDHSETATRNMCRGPDHSETATGNTGTSPGHGETVTGDSETGLGHSETVTGKASLMKSVVCQGAHEGRNDDKEKFLTDLQTATNLLTEFAKGMSSSKAIETVTQGVLDLLQMSKEIEHKQKTAQNFPVKRTFISNQNCESQGRFFVVKRKSSKQSKLRLNKPPNSDVSALKKTLANCNLTRCAVCLREEDGGTEPDILWLQCSSCPSWVHAACSESADMDNYECPSCMPDP